MKNIFKIWALVFLAAISTFGQGTLVQSDVRSTPGPVVPGATITVCAAGATGTPCFPIIQFSLILCFQSLVSTQSPQMETETIASMRQRVPIF